LCVSCAKKVDESFWKKGTNMKEVFSSKLLQFVDSIDILEERSFKKIISLIEKYVEKSLDIKYVKIMHISESMSDTGQALSELFSNHNIPIDNETLNKGQMPFSFVKRKKMWITPHSPERVLCKAKGYNDLWSELEEIPRYRSFDENSKNKTSIIIPLLHDFRKNELIGVVNFESDEYLEPTKIAKETLERLSRIIATSLRLYTIRQQFQESTRKSLTALELAVEEPCFKLTKPKLFFGYPKNSEDDVLAAIKEIIDEDYSKDILFCDWNEKRLPEQISEAVFQEIAHSQYGIYYFSEFNSCDNQYRYHDNRNVIFEAGLHQGRDSDPNWILIREEASENISFDFNNFRRINVPRDSKDALKKEAFKVLLKETLDAMIDRE